MKDMKIVIVLLLCAVEIVALLAAILPWIPPRLPLLFAVAMSAMDVLGMAAIAVLCRSVWNS